MLNISHNKSGCDKFVNFELRGFRTRSKEKANLLKDKPEPKPNTAKKTTLLIFAMALASLYSSGKETIADEQDTLRKEALNV